MTYKLAKTSQDADPYFGAVSLLLDGTDLQDKSLDTKAITAAGNAAVSTAQSKWNGSSLAFDGTGDYLSIPDNDDWDISGDYTVEFWARMPAQSTASYTIGYFGTTAVNGISGFALGHYLGTALLNLNGSVTQSSTVLFTNTWQHIALVISGASAKVYVNGISVISTTSATTATSTSFIVGNFGNLDPNRYFNGYIQDLRITKGVARYTANFTPPTQPFTPALKTGHDPHYFYDVSLLLKGDGTNGSTNIVDSSYDPKTITVNGDAQISTTQSKFGGSSLYFDGTGDYLTAGYTGDWTFLHNGSTFTVECWFNTALTSTATLLSTSASQGNPGFNLNINQGSAGDVRFVFYKGTTGILDVASSASLWDVNTWNHVAAVYNSSTATLTLYVNGVSAGTADGSSFAFNSSNSAYTLAVGRYQFSTPGGYFNGYIDDIRLTKGIARYTSDFTPPTKALPNY